MEDQPDPQLVMDQFLDEPIHILPHDGHYVVSSFENPCIIDATFLQEMLLASDANFICWDLPALFQTFAKNGVITTPWRWLDMSAVMHWVALNDFAHAHQVFRGSELPEDPAVQIAFLEHMTRQFSQPLTSDIPYSRLHAFSSQVLAAMQLKGIPLRHGGLVHPRINMYSGPASRIVYSNPPVQSWGIEDRELVVPRPGQSLWSIDFTAADLQCIASMHRGALPYWAEAFAEDRDPYHGLAEDRTAAKIAVLSVLNGSGKDNLVSVLDDKSAANAIWDSDPVKQLRNLRQRTAASDPRFLLGISGRKLCLPKDTPGHKLLGLQAQASTRDLLVHSLRLLHDSPLRFSPVLLLHDEIIFSLNEGALGESAIAHISKCIGNKLPLLRNPRFRVKGPVENWGQL